MMSNGPKLANLVQKTALQRFSVVWLFISSQGPLLLEFMFTAHRSR